MRCGIHNLHVIRHDEFFQPLSDFFREARFEIQQQFIRETQDIEVRLHFALGGGYGGIGAGAGAEFLNVVCHLAMQITRAVRPHQAKAAAAAQVQYAGGGPQGGVFGEDIAIVRDDFRTI